MSILGWRDPLGLSDPFAALDDPFLQSRRARKPPREAQFPPLGPEEERSFLGKLTSGALGGLGYVGKLLDKPGRAVRGVLSGKPREALAVLPLSDTIGLTDEEEAVSGRDILEKSGLLARNKEGLDLGDIAGFAAEVLLDPLSYLTLGAGALTKLGKTASKLGVVPGKLAQKIRGLPPMSDEAHQLALHLGVPVTEVANKPLAGLFGTGGLARLMGLGGHVFGTGRRAVKVAEFLGDLADRIKFARHPLGRHSPVPVLRGLFDYRAGDTPLPELQRVHEEVVLPLQTAGRAKVMGQHIKNLRRAKEIGIAERGPEEALRQAVEGTLQQLPGGVSRGDVEGMARDLADLLKAERDAQLDLGLHLGYIEDYFPRMAAPLPVGKGGTLGPGPRRFFQPWHPSMLRREKMFMGPARRLATEEIESLVMDPSISGKSATKTPSEAADWIEKNVFGFDDAAASRLKELRDLKPPKTINGAANPEYEEMQNLLGVKKQSAQLARWLRGLPDVFAREKRRFFGAPLDNFTMYMLNGARARAAAEGVYEFLRRNTIQTGTVPDAVPLKDALNDILGPGTGARRLAGAKQRYKRMAGMMDLDVEYLDDLAITKEHYDALTRYMKPFTTPEALHPVLQAVDVLTNTFKAAVTVAFPAFHVRNLTTAIWQNFVGGASDPMARGLMAYIKPFKDAKELADGKTISGISKAPVFQRLGIQDDAEATRMVADWLYQYGAGGPRGMISHREAMITGPGGEVLDYLERSLPGEPVPRPSLSGLLPRSLAEANIFNVPGGLQGGGEFSLVREGDKAARYIDFVGRASAFIAKLKQGFEPKAAADIAMALHYDYRALTRFEKSVMRRLVPFYAFSRKNIPFILENMVTEPFIQATALRAGTQARRDDYVPPWVGEGLAVPLPGAPPGYGRFLGTVGLPIEDEPIKLAGDLLRGNIGRSMMQALGIVNPLIKAPLEYATGKQFFSGRELRDLRPSNVGSIFGLLSDEYAGPLSQIVANTPLARAASVLDKLADTFGPQARKGVLPTAVNLLTGARVTDVDMDKALEVEGRRLLEDLLYRDPQMRRFQKFYPLHGEEISPEQVLLLRLSEGLRRKAHAAALASRAEKGDEQARKKLQRLQKTGAARPPES